MSQLIVPVLIVTAALLFYTLSTFINRPKRVLSLTNLTLYSIGLVCDILGTVLMFKVSTAGTLFTLHGILGYTVLGLMIFTVVWAWGLYKKKTYSKAFRVFSLLAWLLWTALYIYGAVRPLLQ